MDGKKFVVVAIIYSIIAVFVAGITLTSVTSAQNTKISYEGQGETSIYPLTYQFSDINLGDLQAESKIFGGLAGYFIDDRNQPIQIALYPVSLGSSSVSYRFVMEGYGSTVDPAVEVVPSPDAVPGQHIVMEALYHKRWVEHPNTVVMYAAGYIDAAESLPKAVVVFEKLGGTDDNSWTTVKAIVNISDIGGHTLNFNSISDLSVRVFLVPYTEAPEVGTYYNYPELFTVLYATVKDLDGIWTTAYSIGLDGTIIEKNTRANTIIIPLGYIYSLDRSEVDYFYVYISSTYPNYLGFGEDIYDPSAGAYMYSAYYDQILQLPTNMYYPDLMVYYLQPYVTFVQDEYGNFVTSEPIRFVLYSPTAQKAYTIAISLNITHTTTESGNYVIVIKITSASIEQSIDVSTVTGGDILKARLMHPDFISPRAKLYGPIFARQAVYDSDVVYNPYTYKVFIYSSGTWASYVLENVVQKLDYLKPKANVYPNFNGVYGYVTPYIMDVQYKSQDGTQTQGWVTTLLRFIPFKKYDVTPTKFTYRIQYNYYVTPITITYTKSDPDEPDTLTNVLVPINITDSTILNTIVTADARDVRFFQENTYGGDYWKYSGLTYAVKERTTDYVLFYVLIPSITADSPITIYMYSGFQYASPVAADYYSLISTYPILIAQTS